MINEEKLKATIEFSISYSLAVLTPLKKKIKNFFIGAVSKKIKPLKK